MSIGIYHLHRIIHMMKDVHLVDFLGRKYNRKESYFNYYVGISKEPTKHPSERLVRAGTKRRKTSFFLTPRRQERKATLSEALRENILS